MKDIHCEDVGGPATALALNKSTNQVAVVGRSVFKIYSILDNGYELVSNLRGVKNVMASCNDVAWNQVDENILASASPSGAIITWNLNKPGFSKMDMVYSDHRRTVNKVHFHCNDPFLLISGSQDSIKVFDLRQNGAVINYSDLSESVRDLQFSPHKSNSFIAVQDNGYVQLYDIRKKDKYELSFPGHQGPIFACDWHPEHSDVVATAGRDYNIKVWCIANQTQLMQHCIQTMESVSKVRWSYDNTSHIASCSLKRDYSINIWDIYRPFIACARFTEPHEITTGMAWRRGVSNLVLVTSNGNLYQLPMSDAYRPLEHANPVGMAINPDGDIALALGNGLLRSSNHQQHHLSVNNSTIISTDSTTNSTTSSTNNSASAAVSANATAAGAVAAALTGQQQSSASPSLASSGVVATQHQQQSSLPTKFPYQALQFRGRQSVTRRSQDSALKPRISSRSQLDVYKCTEMNWFVKAAQEYQLSNRPLAELCDHNAEVCARLRRFQICQTWKILKLFYANISTTTTATLTTSANNPVTSAPTTAQLVGSKNTIINAATGVAGDDLSLNSQIQMGSEFSYISKNQANRNSLTRPKSITALDESVLADDASLAGSEQSNESTDDWLSHETLSYEAFQPKHDICGRVEKLINHKHDESPSSSASSNHEDDLLGETSNTFNLSQSKSLTATVIDGTSGAGATVGASDSNDLKVSHLVNTKAYQFKFYEIIADVIADVLKYHVDNSDVQSAVSILIVLGDRIKNIVNERIPEVDRESWYYSYIDLLSKFQLWNVMAKVINLSPLQNINSINQTSTTIYTTCGTCCRPLNGKVSWICDRCKTKPSECCVCHGVVAGLMAWCQGCYHGGHLIHMSQWFSENNFCPTGCGHLCEISQWR